MSSGLVPDRHAFDKKLAAVSSTDSRRDLAGASLGRYAYVSSVEEELVNPATSLHMVRRLQQKHPDIAFRCGIGPDLTKARESAGLAGRDIDCQVSPFWSFHRSGGAGFAGQSSSRPPGVRHFATTKS